MAVKPIIFNTEMVRAILSGQKSCTRRTIKLPDGMSGRSVGQCGDENHPLGFMYPCGIKRAPYQRGDVLYVRETWCKYGKLDDCNQAVIEGTEKYYYRADGENPTPGDCFLERGVLREYPVWHPAIHMPRIAARIWLEVTDVRAERLQEITDDSAKKEGANWKNGNNVGWEEKMKRTAIDRFKEIWNSTVKKQDLEKYGWDANPWVWVIEFERREKSI